MGQTENIPGKHWASGADHGLQLATHIDAATGGFDRGEGAWAGGWGDLLRPTGFSFLGGWGLRAGASPAAGVVDAIALPPPSRELGSFGRCAARSGSRRVPVGVAGEDRLLEIPGQDRLAMLPGDTVGSVHLSSSALHVRRQPRC